MRRSDGRTVMRKLILSMVLTLVIGGPAALAQQNGGTSSYPKGSSGPSGLGANVLPAPTGHRQPRASDVPSEKNLSDPNSQANKEDAALDRKIKSICRGC